MSVIARSASDEAISAENKDCFATLAMTAQLNFAPLRSAGEGTVDDGRARNTH
jgi:hypothetical protein